MGVPRNRLIFSPSPNLAYTPIGRAMGSQASRPEQEQPTMPQEESKVPSVTEPVDDDEPDEW